MTRATPSTQKARKPYTRRRRRGPGPSLRSREYSIVTCTSPYALYLYTHTPPHTVPRRSAGNYSLNHRSDLSVRECAVPQTKGGDISDRQEAGGISDRTASSTRARRGKSALLSLAARALPQLSTAGLSRGVAASLSTPPLRRRTSVISENLAQSRQGSTPPPPSPPLPPQARGALQRLDTSVTAAGAAAVGERLFAPDSRPEV